MVWFDAEALEDAWSKVEKATLELKCAMKRKRDEADDDDDEDWGTWKAKKNGAKWTPDDGDKWKPDAGDDKWKPDDGKDKWTPDDGA